MSNTEKPLIGDRVEYQSDAEIVTGYLAEVWVGTITGKGKARIVDKPVDIEDEEAGKVIDFDRIRKAQETT